MIHAEDLGGYYRVPADNRDLNYDAYYSEGQSPLPDRRLQLPQHPPAQRGGDGGDAAGAGVYQRSEVRGQRAGSEYVRPQDGFAR